MSTSAPAPVFSYVGGASAAQTLVKDSPFFGRVRCTSKPLPRECCWSPGRKTIRCAQVPRPEREKTAIAILKYASGGPVLSGMHPMSSHVGWLARHPTNGHLYAASAGRLISLRIAQDGSLRETSSADALGNPAHFELSSDGAWALVANYAESNVVVLPILHDGTVGDAVDSKHHALSAPNPALRDRQESSHPHQVRLDPRGEKWALVPDLGADRVWVYGFDAARGSLLGASNSMRHLVLPAGAGPRHLDFHPNGRWVYVLCELDGKVAQIGSRVTPPGHRDCDCHPVCCPTQIVCCSWDGLSGTLTSFQSVSTLPDRVKPCRAHHSGSAHIRVSRNGRAVYATTRTDGGAVVLQERTGPCPSR